MFIGIDVDSKATLEDFLTLKKRLNLYSFYGNVMKKSVVTRMSLRSDKDVGTYGNAIYPLSRTIIQITNDNSIFRKEEIMFMIIAFFLITLFARL
jgi:hypothetical protein